MNRFAFILTSSQAHSNVNFRSEMRSEDIHQVVRILKRETRRWPVPALAKYLETPFTVLISCILSLRTQDRTTLAASDRLFADCQDSRNDACYSGEED